jgi:hypothetical protein
MNRRQALAALMTLPVATVKLAEVQPDDVLVVQVDDKLTCDQKTHVADVIKRVWPGRRCLVLDGGNTLQIARGR